MLNSNSANELAAYFQHEVRLNPEQLLDYFAGQVLSCLIIKWNCDPCNCPETLAFEAYRFAQEMLKQRTILMMAQKQAETLPPLESIIVDGSGNEHWSKQ